MGVAATRLVICDDNEKVRSTLADYLSSRDDIEVVAEFDSFEELLEEMDDVDADVILADVRLSRARMSGLDGIDALHRKGATVPVVVMSADSRAEKAALSVGATAFFYKGTADLGTLVDLLRKAGGTDAG